MLFLLIIVIFALSPWLYPFFTILYFLLTTASYDYKIFTKKTMIYHLSYLIIMLGFSCYIFCIILSKMGKTINIYDIGYKFSALFGDLYYELPKLLFFSLLILVILYLLIGVMLFKLILLYLKRTVFSIFIYMLHYTTFYNICTKYGALKKQYIYLLTNKVKNPEKNIWLFTLADLLWPRSHYFFEKLIYFSLLPVLLTYDWWFYHGQISKIFMVMPWYYIYSIIRISKYMFVKFFKYANVEMSTKWYEENTKNPFDKEKIKAFFS